MSTGGVSTSYIVAARPEIAPLNFFLPLGPLADERARQRHYPTKLHRIAVLYPCRPLRYTPVYLKLCYTCLKDAASGDAVHEYPAGHRARPVALRVQPMRLVEMVT